MRARTLRRLLNLWPPFLCNGIRVRALAEDWSEAQVTLKLRPWNRNYVGTQFGGNLFAMTDPFWMLLVMHRLGSDYIVWDRAGAIEFVSRRRSHVHAHFRLARHGRRLRREAADGTRCCAGSRSTSPTRPAKRWRACASSCTCGASAVRGRHASRTEPSDRPGTRRASTWLASTGSPRQIGLQ